MGGPGAGKRLLAGSQLLAGRGIRLEKSPGSIASAGEGKKKESRVCRGRVSPARHEGDPVAEDCDVIGAMLLRDEALRVFEHHVIILDNDVYVPIHLIHSDRPKRKMFEME